MSEYSGHRVAVEVVVLDYYRQGVLTVKRGEPPFEGEYMLPAGHVDEGEQVFEAAVREVEEETGVIVEPLQVLGVWDEPGRDPRGPVISIAVLAWPIEGAICTDSREVLDVVWMDVADAEGLPLDEGSMVEKGWKRLGDFIG